MYHSRVCFNTMLQQLIAMTKTSNNNPKHFVTPKIQLKFLFLEFLIVSKLQLFSFLFLVSVYT